MATDFRALENRPGVEFDETDLKRIYAEDWAQLIEAINALEDPVSILLNPATSDVYAISLKNGQMGTARTWRIWTGGSGNYDGYLKFGVNPTGQNDFKFAFTEAGVPVFNTDVGAADNKSFGSYSRAALNYYMPYNSTLGGTRMVCEKFNYKGYYNSGGYILKDLITITHGATSTIAFGPDAINMTVKGTVDADSGFKVGGTAGVDGSFTTADGKTVTVSKGLITNIV